MPYLSSSPARLRLVAFGLHGLRSLLEELVPQFRAQAEILIVDKAYGEAVQAVEVLRQTGEIDVLVSAGSNGSYLREHLDLPVVLVHPGGFDIMGSLAAAQPERKAVVTYGEMPLELMEFVQRFDLPVELRSYRSEDDARSCVQDLKELGVEWVLAPGLVVDLARENQMQAVLLYSQGAVRQALESAIELARVARAEAARRDRLNTILAQLRDGVVSVDRDERIETVNPAMEAWLGKPAQAVIGRRLGSLYPELDLAGTLRSLEVQLDTVQQVGGRTAIVTRMPILEQGRLSGAVLLCQDPAAIQRLDRSLRSRSQQTASRHARYELSDLVGQSSPMRKLRAQAQACAQSTATTLIIGESGTGKELLAQGIHSASTRRAQPFVAVNCAAFPDSLLESELFGYVEGAFTGSSRGGKVGLVEAAHTGTLFLDEIGEMPLPLQTRLLRVLQEKEVLRIGAIEPTPVDVRVIAATHRDLAAQVKEGVFRQDLFYRLNILVLRLPPLRLRTQDLPELVEHLLAKVAQRLGGAVTLHPDWLTELLELGRHYPWPGNIRELENLIERLMVLGTVQGDQAVVLEDIAPELRALMTEPPMPALRDQQERSEQELLAKVLEDCGGNRALAAQQLGISRSTLWRKLRKG